MADILGGLLSNWGNWTGDQEKDGAIRQGLLSAGMALRVGDRRQTLGQALGQAGMQGIQTYQQQMAQQIPNKLAQLQLQNAQADAERRKAMAALAQQYTRTPEQAALAGGGGPTIANAEKIPNSQGGFDYAGYANALAQIDPMQALQLQGALHKDTSPITLGRDQRLLERGTNRVLVDAVADPSKDDAFIRLMKEAGIDPASMQGRILLRQKLQKESTQSPQVQVSYGSPVPVDLGNGQTGYVQPANKPGQAPQIMNDPRTGQPMLKPTDKKEKDLTEAQAKATTLLGQMRSASKELDDAGGDRGSMMTQFNVMAAGTAANPLSTQQAQRINQAQEQWAEAFLRFKTGAASTEQEVRRNVQTFFPRVGDSPDVIAQKKRARMQAEKDMEIAAGRGTSQLDAQTQSKPTGVLKYNPATGRVE